MSRRLLCLTLLLAVTLLSTGPAPAQQDDTPSISSEHYEFWYKNADGVLISRQAAVEREIIPSTEYHDRKQQQIDNVWMPVFLGLLNNDVSKAVELGIPEAQATEMVRMEEDMRQRIGDNPEYQREMAQKMAEWTFFYHQYDLWNRYVGQNVLGLETLAESEKPSYNPEVIDTEITQLRDTLTARAEEVIRFHERRYDGMVNDIEENRSDQQQYEDWLDDQERSMVLFAERWNRRYEGTRFNIGDTVFLVRNVQERPENPEEDFMRENLPPNGVLIEVPKGEMVTPYDLIDEDGEIRRGQAE